MRIIVPPDQAGFQFMDASDSYADVVVWVSDLKYPSNDDVRGVKHPDWDIYWGNAMENVFESWDQKWLDEEHSRKKKKYVAFTTEEEARKWMLSIGMKEQKEEEEEDY